MPVVGLNGTQYGERVRILGFWARFMPVAGLNGAQYVRLRADPRSGRSSCPWWA